MKAIKASFEGVAKGVLHVASWNWKPYSRMILYGEKAEWVLDWEMRELANTCERLGVKIANPIWKHAAQPQSFFFSNHFILLNGGWQKLLPGRIGFSYFHGLPDTGYALFDDFYKLLRQHHEHFTRIQVSHSQMLDLTLGTGIDPSKVFLIPIGINVDFFPFRTVEQKQSARSELGISSSAFVVGSFQKDGVGWEEGLEPKLIKGPDVFLSTMELLKKDVGSDLFVLLSGPSRGYVKRGLEQLQIPYKHLYIKSYPDVAKLFQASDAYLVASRQEGGPKAILESMASGVPIITTRVGQAMDLVKHGVNGWMADVEDAESLARYILQSRNMEQDALMAILRNGRATAEANTYASQFPLWTEFMKGFVEINQH
ncbi:MAG: glycosyltransferase family 4 protein [Anaerolineales bacterium]